MGTIHEFSQSPIRDGYQSPLFDRGHPSPPPTLMLRAIQLIKQCHGFRAWDYSGSTSQAAWKTMRRWWLQDTEVYKRRGYHLHQDEYFNEYLEPQGALDTVFSNVSTYDPETGKPSRTGDEFPQTVSTADGGATWDGSDWIDCIPCIVYGDVDLDGSGIVPTGMGGVTAHTITSERVADWHDYDPSVGDHLDIWFNWFRDLANETTSHQYEDIAYDLLFEGSITFAGIPFGLMPFMTDAVRLYLVREVNGAPRVEDGMTIYPPTVTDLGSTERLTQDGDWTWWDGTLLQVEGQTVLKPGYAYWDIGQIRDTVTMQRLQFRLNGDYTIFEALGVYTILGYDIDMSTKRVVTWGTAQVSKPIEVPFPDDFTLPDHPNGNSIYTGRYRWVEVGKPPFTTDTDAVTTDSNDRTTDED